MYASEILEYCDKVMEVQKIDEGVYKSYKPVDEIINKLFYIN